MKLMMKIRRALRFAVLGMWLVTAGPVLAVDATSFDPMTVAITSQSTIAVGTVVAWPSGSNPADIGKWLECNGQAVPAGSQYDRLRAVLGGQPIPNYNGQFLRGTTTAGLVGTQVSDTIKSHIVSVPGQNAPVSGGLNSTSLSGSASSQTYWFTQTVVNTGGDYTGGGGMGAVTGANYNTETRSTSGGSISGSLNSGSLTGTAYVSAQTGTYSGGSETAPVHTRVRYLIRSIL